MKIYLSIVFATLFVSYVATSVIIYDAFWITKIENWDYAERTSLVVVFFFICFVSKGIQTAHFNFKTKE